MKIGIITILKVNNYGAELQAYATQAYLKKLGYDAEIIDYLFYKNPKHKKTASSRPLFRHSLKKRVSEFLFPILDKVKRLKNKSSAKTRALRFDEFHKTHTSLSKTYRTIDELYNSILDYDVYLTGSDQVWNPGIYSSIAPYFLDFAPKGKLRISYAASFGVSNIPNDCIETYKAYLAQYSAIGVREDNAVDIVNSIVNKTATRVLDPTLLLTKKEWLEVSYEIQVPTENFLLVYELIPCPYIMELSRHIADSKGLKIVRICKDSTIVDDDSVVDIPDAGPSEFVYLFDKASFVVTNSFHGTAFAVNFNKPFYTVLPNHKQNNSRQQSLLNLLGLSGRCLTEGSVLPETTTFDIDFAPVNNKLNVEREKSVNFLINSINGE